MRPLFVNAQEERTDFGFEMGFNQELRISTNAAYKEKWRCVMKPKWSKFGILVFALSIVMILLVAAALTSTQSDRKGHGAETDGITLLNHISDTLTEGKNVVIALEQGEVFHSYGATLDTYWEIRMPTSEEFNWHQIAEEDGRAAISSGNRDEHYRVSISGKDDGKTWSFMVQNGSDCARLTYDDQEYYFAGAEENVYHSDWSAARALRSFYDTMEYKSLGGLYSGVASVLVPDDGQDYLAAALTGYRQQEELHLQVSKGSRFGFSFVKCDVTPAEDETAHFRKDGFIGENTWAVYATTIFVPENESAYNEAMAGNTEEYSGNDAEVPSGAFIYGRVGYVTLTADGWNVSIDGTGW